MDPAALPGSAEQDGGEGALEALVGIGHDEAHAGEAARPQRAQEARPEGAVLAVPDVEPEDLADTARGHAGGLGDDPRTRVGLDRHHPMPFATL